MEWKADERWVMEGKIGLQGKIIARCEGDRDEAREHARLIAAAPDLLAALEAFPGIIDMDKMREWMKQMNAAIKAARGNQ